MKLNVFAVTAAAVCGAWVAFGGTIDQEDIYWQDWFNSGISSQAVTEDSDYEYTPATASTAGIVEVESSVAVEDSGYSLADYTAAETPDGVQAQIVICDEDGLFFATKNTNGNVVRFTNFTPSANTVYDLCIQFDFREDNAKKVSYLVRASGAAEYTRLQDGEENAWFDLPADKSSVTKIVFKGETTVSALSGDEGYVKVPFTPGEDEDIVAPSKEAAEEIAKVVVPTAVADEGIDQDAYKNLFKAVATEDVDNPGHYTVEFELTDEAQAAEVAKLTTAATAVLDEVKDLTEVPAGKMINKEVTGTPGLYYSVGAKRFNVTVENPDGSTTTQDAWVVMDRQMADKDGKVTVKIPYNGASEQGYQIRSDVKNQSLFR